MDNEIKKLNQLLEEKKISEDEFKLLSNVFIINKKSSKFKWSFFVNPFEKIVGVQALFVGLLVILGLCAFAVLHNDNFPGVIDYLYSPYNYKLKTEFKITYSFVLYQNIFVCVILSLFYYGASKFYKQKGLRLIDFFGMVTLSRYPYLIQAFLSYIIFMIAPTTRLTRGRTPFVIFDIIGGVIVMGCVIWQLTTYFFALKEASGLSGKKLFTAYIISTGVSEIICAIITRQFFPPDYHL